MPTLPDDSPSGSRRDLSEEQLSKILRRSANHLEMLASPDVPHHADEPERVRVAGMTPAERESLRQIAVRTISEVRAEFRRRDK
jgi:hypothetical protein